MEHAAGTSNAHVTGVPSRAGTRRKRFGGSSLTTDITVSSSTHMDLSPGKEIYASFKVSETRAYV